MPVCHAKTLTRGGPANMLSSRERSCKHSNHTYLHKGVVVDSRVSECDSCYWESGGGDLTRGGPWTLGPGTVGLGVGTVQAEWGISTST
jgi:hypothetical protein